jgi:acetyl-CoA carboxylase biotin carboxylase subunit
MVTGIDIVAEQIRIAAGHPLGFEQSDVALYGHAIECRVNAEDPETFLPSPGRIDQFHAPGGPGIRVDSASFSGSEIPPYYDSLIGKLIVHATTREACLMRLRRGIEEMVVTGVKTTLPLHRRLVDSPDVQAGDYDIFWLERSRQS